MSLSPERIDRALRRLDAWRRSPHAEPTPQGSYKEWLHFCVRLPGEQTGHLLANFNITERAGSAGSLRVARVITLAHAGDWHGHVETIPDEQVQGTAGTLDLRFGASTLRLADGAFELQLRSAEVVADLRLRPLMLPTGTTSVALDDGHAMQWVAVARLSAHGNVWIGDRCFRIEDAPAYHDHNWGHFHLGADLAWDWGFVHPRDPLCPWSIVLVRVSDGPRHRTLNQFALVWRADAHVRAFLNQELSVDLRGTHVGPHPFTVPGVMSLVVPGAASGVPATIELRAEGLGDELAIEYRTQSKARVAMPSDVHPFQSVLLNETEGAARVRGRIGGESFAFDGSGIVELVRA